MTQHDEQKFALWFEQWLDTGELPEPQMAELMQHPIWSERVVASQQMSELAIQMADTGEVPDWNRNQGFEQHLAQPSWWQRQGMSAMALCFSIFACLVMVFDVKLVSTEQGMNLVWNEQQQNELLQQQFLQLAQMQDEYIDQRLTDYEQKQSEQTASLVNYVLDNSRTERKEDIADMVTVMQQQRQDDMRFLRQQFQDMNYNLRLVQRQNRNNELGYDVEPETSLISEE